MTKKICLSLSLLVTLAMTVGCTRIGPGYVGIKINNSGNNKGVLDTPVTTGWVFYMPGASSVEEFPTFTQTIKWTKNPNEGSRDNEEIVFTNKDQMTIAVDASLSYVMDASKVPSFYVKFHTDDLETFSNGFLHNVARDCFNEHAGKYSINDIMGNNAVFLKEVRDCIDSQVASVGVTVTQFGLIGAPRPPQQVLDAINNAASAQRLAVQKQNELAQVQADVAKQVAAAEGEAKANVAKANGIAEANRIISASINDNILRSKALDNQNLAIWRWNGGTPGTWVSGESGKLMFNIPTEK